MTFVTDFADQAVVLPAVVLMAIILAARGWWRGALALLGVTGVTFGGVLAMKLGFPACGPVFSPWSVQSPSGHTAAAALVAGGMTALLTGRAAAVPIAAACAASIIGFTRTALGFHSLPEVLIGAAAGTLGALMLRRLAGPPPRQWRFSLVAPVIILAVLLHGIRLPAEAAIRQASAGLLDFLPPCRVGPPGPI